MDQSKAWQSFIHANEFEFVCNDKNELIFIDISDCPFTQEEPFRLNGGAFEIYNLEELSPKARIEFAKKYYEIHRKGVTV